MHFACVELWRREGLQVSLGAGHVWATRGFGDDSGPVVIICERCFQSRMAAAIKLKRIRHKPRHGKRYEFTSERFFGGRPLGTCPEVARRRAAGEAEIRATLDAFE